MKLSKRLETIASFVPKGSKIADIGTDHGYIPIYLVENGAAVRALAMDVREGPLARAREHVEEHGLSDRIETRLSDGMEKLRSGEADTVIIAGMGGELVIHILEEGRRLWPEVRSFVLSPHSELHKVRRYLRENGFAAEDETMVKDEGKFYTVMRVRWDGGAGTCGLECCAADADSGPRAAECRVADTGHGPWATACHAADGAHEPPREIDDLYGARLLRMKHPVLKEYLEKEREKAQSLLKALAAADTDGARARAESLSRELERIKEAEDEMQ